MTRFLKRIFLAASTLVAACAHAQCPVVEGSDYELRVNDTIEIHYIYTPEFDETVSIASDGTASSKQAGSIKLAGQNIKAAQEEISLHTIRLNNPKVIVILKDRLRIFVGGEVGAPGKFELQGNETMMEAIAQAGGFKNSAKQSQIILVRSISADLGETIVVDTKKHSNNAQHDQNPTLCPGDYIFVPQNRISKVERIVRLGNLGFYLSPTTF